MAPVDVLVLVGKGILVLLFVMMANDIGYIRRQTKKQLDIFKRLEEALKRNKVLDINVDGGLLSDEYIEKLVGKINEVVENRNKDINR